jgi:hypothetical protein
VFGDSYKVMIKTAYVMVGFHQTRNGTLSDQRCSIA